jgi:hypothetical protein
LDSTSNQSTTHPSQANFSFTTIDSSTTSSFLEQTSSSHLSLSSLPRYHDVSEDQFQNSNLEFRNFEIPIEEHCFFKLSGNSKSSLFSKMEADCKDVQSDLKMSPDMINIAQMIANLSNQVTNQTQSLEGKISRDFSKVIEDNESFKNDVRAELDGIRQLLDKYNITSDPNAAVSSVPVVSSGTSTSSPQGLISSNVPPQVTPSVSSSDPQTNLMLMLTETFSKLTTTLAEKNENTKGDWPKFAGDSKKFRAWYMAIVTQISLAPWQDLYDSNTNDVCTSTTNSSLNAKLYAKLLTSLEGLAFQSIISREHLRANGLLLLQDLVQTYKPKQVPEVIAAKTSIFWGSTKRQPHETIDEYYNRFKELLYEISSGPDQISSQSAMRHFIFTLGSEFETIQNNYRIDNLPVKWQTADWPTLLILCRDYFNSVRPQGVMKTTTNSDGFIDHTAHRKKVKAWFMNPSKFCKEIEAEQNKHPHKCIYHLSKTHPTEECSVKKECDKLIANRKITGNSTNGSTQSNTSGQLRHITEEISQDVEPDDEDIDVSNEDDIHNDTNEAVLSYFSRVTRHYLRLVKTKPELITRHDMRFPIIADSGANFHMFKDKDFFEHISPAHGQVILGDGKTTLPIKGIGTIKLRIADNILSIDNVRYVPGLSESIYSLFLHIRTPNHGINSSFEDGLHIIFPEFQTKAILGNDDVYLNGIPASIQDTGQIGSDKYTANRSGLTSVHGQAECRHITHHDGSATITSKKESNLLCDLRQYYNEVKTKRQLNMNVPAGFRHNTSFQRRVHDFRLENTSPPELSTSDINNTSSLPDSLDLSSLSDIAITSPSISEVPVIASCDSLPNLSSTTKIPILRCVDKASTSLPNHVTCTEDFIRASVGFRRIDTLKTQLKSLYLDTVSLDSLPIDAVLDAGDFATMKKSSRNTKPVPRPSYFGEVVHMDIVFGPEVSLGNVHFALLFTDRFSRMTYLYPLKNLTSDIRKQMEYFFAHIGFFPTRLITDFDTKLIGGKARDYLNSLLIHVNAAPSHRQDRNGLAERHWQTMTSMARNWLASAELPAKFWFFAVKRAAEVCNYFPIRLEDGTWSTPLELAHRVKPDLRFLFKMFGLAAVRRERSGNLHPNKFEAQSVPMIAVGRCPHSMGLQFYNPENGTLVSSIDYKFQLHTTSGTFFKYRYQPGTFFYRLDESNSIFSPKFNIESSVLVHTHSPPSLGTIIGIPSYQSPNIYTVSFRDGSISEYSEDLLSLAPESMELPPKILPHWIKNDANATLFLESMSRPRHGVLRFQTENWYFFPGKSTEGILLSDLQANCQELLDTGQLFRGHAKFKNVYDARSQISLRDCVLRHVSAHGLKSLLAPTSLKSHSSLDPEDKIIWDAAYDEEYDGLESLPTWEIITEAQYKQLSKGRRALPTMAIATVKYDANNRPKRAKYRIVVLGNLDYHTWSKEQTAAPVMSQLELRLLTSLAVYNKRVLKNCDVKQAFIQSSLPSDEEYILRPPVGCPRSKPGQYWRLLRSLYGLKRAPKLWYQLLSTHLKTMGLKSSVHSPCLFTGVLVPGEPPIFVGIYVDDIIYFSASDQTEKKFEELLSSIGQVEFMGQVTLFLGTEFSWVYHSDGHLSVSLTQQSFVETLIDSLNISSTHTSTFTTPYRTGINIDSIPTDNLSTGQRDELRLRYQSLIGSLNWLSITTRPDISTVVSLLAQHQSNPSSGHMEAAIYVAQYLANTKTLGIYFSSNHQSKLESFLHFPLDTPLLPMSDANWGPQDASVKGSGQNLPLFISRSMSAFYIDLLGPLHWMSKRQKVTAASSAEAEIYATDECVKFLLDLVQIMEFLGIKDLFMPSTNTIYNDNKACIQWSKKATTKGLRHVQMRENRVRENVTSQFVTICHVDGRKNIADIFTKEMRDTAHFIELRNLFMRPRIQL